MIRAEEHDFNSKVLSAKKKKKNHNPGVAYTPASILHFIEPAGWRRRQKSLANDDNDLVFSLLSDLLTASVTVLLICPDIIQSPLCFMQAGPAQLL